MSGVTAKRASLKRSQSSSPQEARAARRSLQSGKRSRKSPPSGRRNRAPSEYDLSVFINCPFDRAYLRLFRSIVFTVFHCGFLARCALEVEDSSQVRIDKILRIIRSCRYGIHDLSRTELDNRNRLPRFNMPLELGLFIAAKEFGGAAQRRKVCLILDRAPHRYQKFISDIGGQDIQAHDRQERRAIAATRNWLSQASRQTMPGGAHIYRRYQEFTGTLPALCVKAKMRVSELTYKDYVNFVAVWLAAATIEQE